LIENGDKNNVHFTAQVNLCGGLKNSILHYDFIGLLENRKNTLRIMKLVAKNLKHPKHALKIVNQLFSTNIETKNKWIHFTNTVEHMNEISKTLKDKIMKFYRKDGDLITFVHQHGKFSR